MNIIKSFFLFELKRRLQRREIAIFAAVLLLLVFFIDQEKNKYAQTLENQKVFQETEDRLVKSYLNYTQYGSIGIRLLFIPSPFSTLYNNPIFEGLLSSINTGKKLTLDKTLKGKHFFVKNSPFNDFSGLVLLCIAFFVVFYGYITPRKKSYLRFLSGFSRPAGKCGNGKLFFALVVTRLLLLMLVFLLLFGVSLLWLGIHHINLVQTISLFYILLVFIAVVFFFFAGFLFGTLKKKAARSLGLLVFYAGSFILFPMMLSSYNDIDVSDMESLFTFELKNLELVMDVEKRLIKKFGLYKSGGAVSPALKEKIIEALNNEYKKIFAREERLKDTILEKVRNRHRASCLYPVLFYNTAVRELSSCGELSVIDFYRISLKRKMEFLDFFVEKKFMQPGRPGRVESFVKGDENLFYAKGHLPYGFWWGISLTVLYIFITAAASYYRFNRLLSPAAVQVSKDSVNLKLNKGEDVYINTRDSEFVGYFCTGLSGNMNGFPGTVSIDGNKIAGGHKHDFLYVCRPGDIPGDIEVDSLTRLLIDLSKSDRNFAQVMSVRGKRFNGLDADEKAKILFLLALLKDCGIYLFHELTDECSNGCAGELVEKVKKLLSGGRRVAYFSRLGYPNPLLNVDRFFIISKEDTKYESKEFS